MNVNVIHEECIGNYLFSFTYRVESTNTLQVADGHQPADPGSLGLIHPFFFASLILPRFPFAVQPFKHTFEKYTKQIAQSVHYYLAIFMAPKVNGKPSNFAEHARKRLHRIISELHFRTQGK